MSCKWFSSTWRARPIRCRRKFCWLAGFIGIRASRLPKRCEGNGAEVLIESYIVELTEAAGHDLGLSKFAPPNGDQEGLHPLFKNEETQYLLKRIKETEGADILSAPRILTLNGNQGIVSIPEPFQAPNGHEL